MPFLRRLASAGLLALASLGCASLRAPLTGPAQGGAPWTEVTSSHFVLRTDAEPREAQALVNQFEGLHAALAFVLQRPATTAARIELVRFERQKDLVEVAQRGPTERAYFSPQLPGDLEPRSALVFYGEELADVARETFLHELTHRFLHERFVALPLWLNEGLAQYYETLRVDDGRLLLGEPGGLDFWEQSFASMSWRGSQETLQVPLYRALSVWKLVDADRTAFYVARGREKPGEASNEDWTRETASYASAWKLVHYFLNGPDAGDRDRFQSFLQAVQRGGRAREAFLETFGADLPRLEASFRRYLLEARLQRRVVEHPPAPVATPLQVRTMSDAEVHLLWAYLVPTKKGGRELARRQLDEALASDPRSSEVRYARAIFFTGQQRFDEADRELSTALAARPDDPRYLYARLSWHVDRAAAASPAQKGLSLPEDVLTRLERTATSAWQLNVAASYARVQGRVDDALGLSARSIAADPLCWTCQVGRARVLFAADRLDEATAAVERALAVLPEKSDPSDITALRAVIEKARVGKAAPR